MQKVVLIIIIIFAYHNTLISMYGFYEYQAQKRACEDELRKAASVLIMSVEENVENHDLIKIGDYDVIPDELIMLDEFNAFLSNSSYIAREDIKVIIMIFGGAIRYYNNRDEEIYTEALLDSKDKQELSDRIKRQLAMVFYKDEFEIDKRLFEEISDKEIILIYERPYRIISSISGERSAYAFSRLYMQ